jgi:hypothetical protein
MACRWRRRCVVRRRRLSLRDLARGGRCASHRRCRRRRTAADHCRHARAADARADRIQRGEVRIRRVAGRSLLRARLETGRHLREQIPVVRNQPRRRRQQRTDLLRALSDGRRERRAVACTHGLRRIPQTFDGLPVSLGGLRLRCVGRRLGVWLGGRLRVGLRRGLRVRLSGGLSLRGETDVDARPHNAADNADAGTHADPHAVLRSSEPPCSVVLIAVGRGFSPGMPARPASPRSTQPKSSQVSHVSGEAYGKPPTGSSDRVARCQDRVARYHLDREQWEASARRLVRRATVDRRSAFQCSLCAGRSP